MKILQGQLKQCKSFNSQSTHISKKDQICIELKLFSLNFCRDESNFNVEQIKGIMEYIPSEEESMSLQRYTSCIKSIKQGQLCECEKFMCAIVRHIPVSDAKRKIQCMYFKLTFQSSVNDIKVGKAFNITDTSSALLLMLVCAIYLLS